MCRDGQLSIACCEPALRLYYNDVSMFVCSKSNTSVVVSVIH